jgi:hypothetical protein
MSKALTKDQQYMVFTYYLGVGFQLGVAYLSPLSPSVRGKIDRQSSFNIYESNGNLRWKDFGGIEDLNGDAIDFIVHMEQDIYNLPKGLQFSYAMDFFKNVISNNRHITQDLILKQSSHSSSNKQKQPTVKWSSEFKDFEKLYWDQYLMKPDFLREQRTYVLDGIDWGDGLKFPSKEGDPAFIFDLSEDGDLSSWKAYRPLTQYKRFKWKSWNLSAIPFEGYHLLPDKGERLLFTSGRKDGYVGLILDQLYDYYFNWSVGNPTGENAYKSIIPYVPELNERFDWIGILFDGDVTGLKAAKHFGEMTGLNVIYLDYPIKTGERLKVAKMIGSSIYTKDLAEVIENYGYDKLFELMCRCTISTH